MSLSPLSFGSFESQFSMLFTLNSKFKENWLLRYQDREKNEINKNVNSRIKIQSPIDVQKRVPKTKFIVLHASIAYRQILLLVFVCAIVSNDINAFVNLKIVMFWIRNALHFSILHRISETMKSISCTLVGYTITNTLHFFMWSQPFYHLDILYAFETTAHLIASNFYLFLFV